MEIDKMKKEIRRGGFMRKLLKSKFFRVVCCVAFVGVALAKSNRTKEYTGRSWRHGR